MITPSVKRLLFIIIILLTITTFSISLWDILYQNEWLIGVMAAYAVLFILSILLFIIRRKPSKKDVEKLLKGDITHFKCPQCEHIFSLKKSKKDNQQKFTIHCPKCGMKGTISPRPPTIQDTIPDQKSVQKTYICRRCGEWISISSEEKAMSKDLRIGICPFCGKQGSMTA